MAVTYSNIIRNHRGLYFEVTGDGATTALTVNHNCRRSCQHHCGSHRFDRRYRLPPRTVRQGRVHLPVHRDSRHSVQRIGHVKCRHRQHECRRGQRHEGLCVRRF
jgi:hypothetical protein